VDVLWSPWRYDYIKAEKPTAASSNCVFCYILNSSASDEEKFILHRAEHNFVILNIYPYTTGHLMIVPFSHLANLDEVSKEITDELMDLTKKCQTVLREVYQPNGFNIGINQGKAGGAGVAEHLHQHILPRWIGDANFMTAIGQTRTLPENLTTTYQNLINYF
jgi:ATP adenylyltransferase